MFFPSLRQNYHRRCLSASGPRCRRIRRAVFLTFESLVFFFYFFSPPNIVRVWTFRLLQASCPLSPSCQRKMLWYFFGLSLPVICSITSARPSLFLVQERSPPTGEKQMFFFYAPHPPILPLPSFGSSVMLNPWVGVSLFLKRFFLWHYPCFICSLDLLHSVHLGPRAFEMLHRILQSPRGLLFFLFPRPLLFLICHAMCPLPPA